MLGGRTHDEPRAHFIAARQNIWNRKLHFVGIPMLVGSGQLGALLYLWKDCASGPRF